MEHPIIIEHLRTEDIPAVTNLINTIVPWEVSCQAAEAAYKAMLAQGNSTVLVAKDKGTVVGTVTALFCRALAENFLVIEDVVVAPDRTGQGIGSMLMEAADAFARERNCGYAILVSSGHRTLAHKFYEKCGFIEDVRGFRKGYE